MSNSTNAHIRIVYVYLSELNSVPNDPGKTHNRIELEAKNSFRSSNGCTGVSDILEAFLRA